MVTVLSREQWGAAPPTSRTPLDRSAQEGTALHYTAAAADERRHHENCAGRVRAIQDYHQGTRGFADIAYSWLACRHGFLFEGRGVGTRTAGQGTTAGNDRWHAVCFLGDDAIDRRDATPEARHALAVGIELCNQWSGARRVEPHSYFHATLCPGDELRSWLAAGMPLEEDDVTPEELKAAVAEALHDMTRDQAPSDWAAELLALGHEAKNNAREAMEASTANSAALGRVEQAIAGLTLPPVQLTDQQVDRFGHAVADRLVEVLRGGGSP